MSPRSGPPGGEGPGPPGGRVAGLILAAGLSSRMHPFKLLLPYAGGTVVGAVADAALAAGLDPVVAVVGHRAEEVRRALRGKRLRCAENPDYRAGQGTSLAAGVRALEEGAEVAAAAVLLGDEPGVRPAAIRAAVRAWSEAWEESGAWAVRLAYRDRPGHPVVLARSAFPMLGGLSGDRGAWDELELLGREVRTVRVEEMAPVDVDTAAAYREALREATRGGDVEAKEEDSDPDRRPVSTADRRRERQGGHGDTGDAGLDL